MNKKNFIGKKAMYENKGYNLIKTIAGFNQIKFIYKPNN